MPLASPGGPLADAPFGRGSATLGGGFRMSAQVLFSVTLRAIALANGRSQSSQDR
jgi:hypothetical protein